MAYPVRYKRCCDATPEWRTKMDNARNAAVDLILSIGLLFVITVCAPAEGLAQTSSKGTPTPVAPPASIAADHLSDATVTQLVVLGERPSFTRRGIYRSSLQISSARSLIANMASLAVAKGGHYLPPESMRDDVVFVSCGDAKTIRDRWDCDRLAVSTSTGRSVTPITYASGPKVYQNAFSATWTARRVEGTFRVSDLRDGFVVAYAGIDGTQYREEVPKTKAESDLLFTIPGPSVDERAEAAAAKPAAVEPAAPTSQH